MILRKKIQSIKAEASQSEIWGVFSYFSGARSLLSEG